MYLLICIVAGIIVSVIYNLFGFIGFCLSLVAMGIIYSKCTEDYIEPYENDFFHIAAAVFIGYLLFA